MKQKANRIVWLDRLQFPCAIGFVPNKEAWEAELQRTDRWEDYPLGEFVSGHVSWQENSKTGEQYIYIFLREVDDPFQLFLTIVHEAVHVWQFAVEAMGEREPGIEIEAYTIENFTRQLVDAYCLTTGKDKLWR